MGLMFMIFCIVVLIFFCTVNIISILSDWTWEDKPTNTLLQCIKNQIEKYRKLSKRIW